MISICHFFLSPWLLPAWAFGATWRLSPAHISIKNLPILVALRKPKASFLLSPAGVRRSSSRGFLPCDRKNLFRPSAHALRNHISRRKIVTGGRESIATVILSWWLVFLICFWFETSSIDSKPKKKYGATPSENQYEYNIYIYNLLESFRSWTIGFLASAGYPSTLGGTHVPPAALGGAKPFLFKRR